MGFPEKKRVFPEKKRVLPETRVLPRIGNTSCNARGDSTSLQIRAGCLVSINYI